MFLPYSLFIQFVSPVFLASSALSNSCLSIGLFAKAAHDLLSSLRGNSVNSLYWLSEIPSTLTYPSVPGKTTSIRRMYLEAVGGFSLTVLCIMVDVESPANARETPPPERKGCIERIECARRPSWCDILVLTTLVSLNGCDPCTGQPPASLVGHKYPLVMSYPTW